MSEDSKQSRTLPISDLDFSLMTTDNLWGKHDVPDSFKQKLKKYYKTVTTDKDGKVTEEIENSRDRRGVKGNLSAKRMINNYQRYAVWRGLIETQSPARPEPISPSAVALWRDNKGGLALYGVKCTHCGFVQYPAQRVCVNCITKDEFEPYRFAGKVGTLFTFSHDNLAASIDPPTTVCAVDFPEGGRIMCDMTDRDPDEVKVGMPVEMTFRQVGTSGDIHNYWWKCHPLR